MKDPFEHLRVMNEDVDLSKGILGLSQEEEKMDSLNSDVLLDSDADKIERKSGFGEFISYTHRALNLFTSEAVTALVIGTVL